jgi:dephospho-CoA kinase
VKEENKKQKSPFIIGLTGGIACGKSGIASLFAKLNVPIVDADIVARSVVEPGTPLLKALTTRFGIDILQKEGCLDRKKLREIVFDPKHLNNLSDLNALMSPAIINELVNQINQINAPYVIVVVPLLFEHHLEHLVDRVLVVDIEEEIQLKRLLKRDNINETIAKSMIANQVDRQTRIKKADDLIKSDEHALDKKTNLVLKLHNQYLQFSNTKNKEF